MNLKGFLIVLAQPEAIFEEEFNAWYDTEHLIERLAVPGFEAALRYVCPAGVPKYLAVYDLENESVLNTPDYLNVSFEKSSPWTKRVTGRGHIYRSAGTQIYPGDALTRPCARLLIVRFRGLRKSAGDKIVSGMRANFEHLPETIQVRVFAHDAGGAFDFLGLVEARAPLDKKLEFEAFGGYADAIDLFNMYLPY
jgi:hypothetical protein